MDVHVSAVAPLLLSAATHDGDDDELREAALQVCIGLWSK
jgi:hypothetical protein